MPDRFEGIMDSRIHDIRADELESALHRGEFCFYYQPKVSFLTGKMVGGEALLRWVQPDGRVLVPGDFFPAAERFDLLSDITTVMLVHLIEDIERLREVKPDIQVAYNVTATDLYSPYLVKMLRSFIGNRRINPGNLQIEITETAVVDNSQRIQKSLLDLVALGIELVMDDYGTGYSSLDLLSRLPFSALKLDQGVVRRMTEDARNTHIVRASLSLARELSMKTVAEGVETEATYVFLMSSGCSEAQGYWMSRPLQIDRFIELYETDITWPSSYIGSLHNAETSHQSYSRKVLDLVYTLMRTSPEEWRNMPLIDLAHSPARCRLGQWYMAGPNAGGRPIDIAGLNEAHKLMHEAGEMLIESIRAGTDKNAVFEAIKTFLERSDVVDSKVSRLVERWFEDALKNGD